MRLQREVAGVEEADDRAGNVAFERLRTGRQEEGIVLAPYCQKRRPVRAEVILESRVQCHIALVVAEQVQLDLIGPLGVPDRSCRATDHPEKQSHRRSRRGYIASASLRERGRRGARPGWLATTPASRRGWGSSRRSTPPHRRCRSER